jgi:hypothetical protein
MNGPQTRSWPKLGAPLAGCTGLIFGRRSSDFFLAGVGQNSFLIVFRRPKAIRVNVVHLHGVTTLIVVVAGWS